MPPRLSQDQTDRITAQIEAGIHALYIAKAEKVGKDTTYRIQRNIRGVGQPYPLSIAVQGRPQLLTPAQEDGLLEYLTGRPDAMLEDMQDWLWDRLDVSISIATISRTLKRRK